MSRYAEGTQVSSDASRQEIERTLSRYGATSFAYGWQSERAMVGFEIDGRQVRFHLPLPDRQDRRFTHTPSRGARRSESAAAQEYEKAVRQRWRALALVVKAKLEAVESGFTSFDEEFLAHLVLPGGRSVYEHVAEQVEASLESGRPPQLIALEGGR